MDNLLDLRKILSQNIKAIRGTLHISQAKLAEYAEISPSYLTDIECCRTWVSDKTLNNLARALNREAWELLVPNGEKKRPAAVKKITGNKRDETRYIADLIAKKKEVLRHVVNKSMEELVIEITQDM